MSDLRKAAQQALEALLGVLDTYDEPLDLMTISGGTYEALDCRDAITALRAALAPLAQPEPVISSSVNPDKDEPITDDMMECWRVNYGLKKREPADAASWWAIHYKGAPAGAVAALGLTLNEIDRLRAAPPQRKPLTLQEVDAIWATKTDIESVVRAVEKAHGIE